MSSELLISRRRLIGGAAIIAGGLLVGLTPQEKKLLELTEDNIEGPFWRKDAPFRSKLAEGLPGDPLTITGRVLDREGRPLRDAVVDIWHADKDGDYDNRSDKFLMRGRIKTDRDGVYSYETIVPGQYDMGESKRPAHIHYKIASDGYRSLTTQLYFKGDRFLAKDPFVRPSLIIELAKKEKLSAGTFDIVLAKA